MEPVNMDDHARDEYELPFTHKTYETTIVLGANKVRSASQHGGKVKHEKTVHAV